MTAGVYMAVIGAGYLAGSIPTGYLAGKAKGIDLRNVGSGNIGATNALRVLGKPIGILVLIVDALKGYAACTWLVDLILGALQVDPELAGGLRIAGGIASILGHNYTCWLRFRGGKGIATSAGVLAALVPTAFFICVGVWVLTFVASRYVSLASIAAAFLLPFACWFSGYGRNLVLITALMGALAIYKHRSNIRRLLDGTEHRFTSKRKQSQT